MDGWIKIHRKMNDTAFKTKPLVVALFLHLLTNANHKPNKFLWNNKEITIQEGQLITGRKELSKQTGISEQSIRTGLTILKSTSTITIKSTSKFSLISILNWHTYQGKSTNTSTNKLTNEQPATNQQLTTNKNDKNVKNDKNNTNVPDKRERNINHPYRDIITYCKEKQNLSNEFVNYVKQTTAVKKILSAKYSLDDIRFVIDEMCGDPYWSSNPFDLMSVANQMHRYMNRIVIFKKGGEQSAKY